MRILHWLMGRRRLTVTELERHLLVRRGRVADILEPGEHWLRAGDTTEVFSLRNPVFTSPFADVIVRDHPDLAARHLTEVRTGPAEVAVIERDGRVYRVLGPDTRLVVLDDAGPWRVTRFDLDADLAVPAALGPRLDALGVAAGVAVHAVADAHVAVMTVDGAGARVLEPGTHRFWTHGGRIATRLVDLRWRTHDVTGHEILTRDRVTLRVNIAADFRVTDPVRAVTAVRDFEDALHRALALAFRRTLGAMTLDALLADKVSVDAEAAETVRRDMAAIGVEVGAIALRDVILPGEMRDILTAVVAAEKEAEANVIRRREETNATRSLLNTAKVMAENPVMLRLKELEALERVADRVGHLTVHNGTEGLLGDIVRLRD